MTMLTAKKAYDISISCAAHNTPSVDPATLLSKRILDHACAGEFSVDIKEEDYILYKDILKLQGFTLEHTGDKYTITWSI